MNILTTYVKNIRAVTEISKGWYEVVCDTDCWGDKREADTIRVTEAQLKSIRERGEYEG